MKQETKRLSSLIIAALVMAGALILYFEFIVPAYGDLQTLKGQEESESTLLSNEQQIVTQGKSLLATYQSDTASSQAVAMALPVGQDVAGALAQVYGLGANAGITVTNTGISIQAVQAVTSQNGVAGGQIANAAVAGSVLKPTGSVSLQISASGSYESLKAFLQGIETNIRIFDVTGISMQPAGILVGKASQATSADLFNYTITVVTYYQAT